MDKFEYYTYCYDTEGWSGGKVDVVRLQAELNRLGEDGWELVSGTSSNQAYGQSRSLIFIFKRKLNY
ncbi:MAG TPA: DUF4177 domain-containing protein [Oscillospiraceae bacterium]|nr:DUF4177 domain-containing protein [Oscillospiraceae bacterium]HPF55691.1 DUF4177 domain-containing protein [Clostridiales bacterium]HPK35722.1 DUF4177 domain-containing protein [Oscillospiraceae bacterium]HPR75070.1 DUF4177 domain-containing protein [Oscillospiraceae bacterium]